MGVCKSKPIVVIKIRRDSDDDTVLASSFSQSFSEPFRQCPPLTGSTSRPSKDSTFYSFLTDVAVKTPKLNEQEDDSSNSSMLNLLLKIGINATTSTLSEDNIDMTKNEDDEDTLGSITIGPLTVTEIETTQSPPLTPLTPTANTIASRAPSILKQPPSSTKQKAADGPPVTFASEISFLQSSSMLYASEVGSATASRIRGLIEGGGGCATQDDDNSDDDDQPEQSISLSPLSPLLHFPTITVPTGCGGGASSTTYDEPNISPAQFLNDILKDAEACMAIESESAFTSAGGRGRSSSYNNNRTNRNYRRGLRRERRSQSPDSSCGTRERERDKRYRDYRQQQEEQADLQHQLHHATMIDDDTNSTPLQRRSSPSTIPSTDVSAEEEEEDKEDVSAKPQSFYEEDDTITTRFTTFGGGKSPRTIVPPSTPRNHHIIDEYNEVRSELTLETRRSQGVDKEEQESVMSFIKGLRAERRGGRRIDDDGGRRKLV